MNELSPILNPSSPVFPGSLAAGSASLQAICTATSWFWSASVATEKPISRKRRVTMARSRDGSAEPSWIDAVTPTSTVCATANSGMDCLGVRMGLAELCCPTTTPDNTQADKMVNPNRFDVPLRLLGRGVV
jgi:hypothetical protein